MPGQKTGGTKLVFVVDGNTGTQLSEGGRWWVRTVAWERGRE